MITRPPTQKMKMMKVEICKRASAVRYKYIMLDIKMEAATTVLTLASRVLNLQTKPPMFQNGTGVKINILINLPFYSDGDEDEEDDDDDKAGPPGEYEENDEEDDEGSDLGEGEGEEEEEEEVGLSYLMKEEIQVHT